MLTPGPGWEVEMRYETTTKLMPDEALALAERYFTGELGLNVRTRDPRRIGLEGGGGHVTIAVTGEHPTTLDIETREWDQPVVTFMGTLRH
jgi:hypothetical protein